MKWKRIIGWIAAVVLILIVGSVVTGIFVVRSQRFHRYVLAKIVEKGNAATGGTVEIRGYDFHWTKLTAEAYGVIIHGLEKSNEKPLLQVNKMTLRLKILSILHQKVNLQEALIEHPVVHLAVDKSGRSNIPSPKAPKRESTNVDIFDLAVGHVLLSNGEIYYNDRQLSLIADVYDLKTEIGYSLLTTSYDGSLSYKQGQVTYAGLNPLPHSFEAKFNATPARLAFDPVVLTVGSSRIFLRADMTNYSNPRFDGSYNVLLHTQDFAGLMKPAKPAGDLALAGGIHYQSSDQPVLLNVALDGQLNGGELKVISPEGHIEFRSIRGRYQFARGNLQARDLAVNLLKGQLTGDLSIQHMDATPVSRLHASLRGISLDARESLNAPSFQRLPLTGKVDGKTDASWVGGMKNLQARSDLTLQAAVMTAASGTKKSVPVNGVVHMDYDGRRNAITVRQTVIRTPTTTITADGTMSERSELRIQARTSNLEELATLANALQTTGTPASQPVPKPLSVSGSAVVDATVRGRLQNPHVSAQVTAQNLQAEGSQWRSLRMGVQASASEIALQNGSLISAQQGQASFNVRVGLRNWSYDPSNPISATLSVRQMSLAGLQQIARLNYPATGDLTADVTLQGSQLNPVGHGSAKLVKARVYNQPIQTLTLQFKAANSAVDSTWNVKTPAGSADAKLIYYPKTRGYDVRLNTSDVALEKLEAIQAKNLAVKGTLTASANGKGTLDNPQLTATVQVPQLQVQQSVVTGVKAQLNVANHRAEAALSSSIEKSSLQAKANINLDGRDYYTTATIDTTALPVAALLAVYVPSLPTGLQGQMEFHASLKGPLKDKSRMEAHLVIPTMSASYEQVQISNAGPIRIDYANSLVSLQPSELRGTGTSIRFAGQVPLRGTSAMTLNAQGDINLRLLRLVSPDVRSSGTMALDVRTTGSTHNPQVTGTIRLQNAALTTATTPFGLEQMNGLLNLNNDRAQISNLTAQLGGGQVTATGFVTYRPEVQFNLVLNGNSVRLRYPEGLRSVLNTSLTLIGNRQAARLDGRVLIDSLSFTQDFDLANFMNQFTGETAPPSGQSFADNLNLNISVQSTEQLSAVSSQVSLEGQANLRVIGTASNPVIVGRADLTSGEIFFMKKRYELERGIINFTRTDRTSPEVNLLITTTIKQYNLSLTIVGPIDKLRTSYVSDPPLPPVDVINLIARGQTTEETTPTSLGANSILAQGLASQVGSQISKLAGISSLTIDPLIGGDNRNPSARIAIQQRVTKNFIFTFSTDVTSAQREVIQLEYQLNRRWSVSAIRDENGGAAFDAKFHKVF
jgi:translocation and assembly module TamB